MWGGRSWPRLYAATRPLHFGAEGEARSDLCGAAARGRGYMRPPGRSTLERRAKPEATCVGRPLVAAAICGHQAAPLWSGGRSPLVAAILWRSGLGEPLLHPLGERVHSAHRSHEDLHPGDPAVGVEVQE